MTAKTGRMPMSTLVAIAILAAPGVAQTQVRYQDLRSRVFRAVEQNIIQVRQPSFDWTGDYMRYDLSPACEPSPEKDPLEQPFVELLTVAAIRKYRMRTPRPRQFWSRVLPKVEVEIERMVARINDGGPNSEELAEQLSELSFAISRIYDQELNALAKKEGKLGASTGKACALYSISTRAEPASATIRYMRSGAFLLHICLNNGSAPAWTDTKWETAPTGGQLTIGEKTRFHVRWEDGFEKSGTISAQTDGKLWTLVVNRTRGFRWER